MKAVRMEHRKWWKGSGNGWILEAIYFYLISLRILEKEAKESKTTNSEQIENLEYPKDFVVKIVKITKFTYS